MSPPRRGASCAGGWATTCQPHVATDIAASEEYVAALLHQYLSLPGTPGCVRPADRRCARALYRRGVSLATAQAALIVAAARRTFRSPERPPLATIRALHYFLPVIEELLEQPLEPGYVAYLARRLEPWMKPTTLRDLRMTQSYPGEGRRG